MADAVAGDDGRLRCPWAVSTPDLRDYHDTEWGRPISGDRAVFERMSLEAMQSGLSWLIVLRKRESMRAAFEQFDLEKLAAWDQSEIERTMLDPGVIRNRAKINSIVNNARVALELPGGLAAFIGDRAPTGRARPNRLGDVRSTSQESVAIAKEMKAVGIKFVGPTTMYALLQAGGWVDDHLAACEF